VQCPTTSRHSGTTTQADRQTIIRLLLERVLVEVIDDSEQVRVECHWQGGIRTEHRIVRPGSCAKRLSTYPALVARVTELRKTGLDSGEIAKILNREGWRPAKRCDAFSGSMVRNLLRTAYPEAPVSRLRHPVVEPERDEWTVPELARQLGLPQSTVYSWVHRDRLPSRSISGGSRLNKLVRADSETIAALKAKPVISAS
jgi:excisionase family DNA binding protein